MGRLDISRLKQRAKKSLNLAGDLTSKLGYKAKAVLEKQAYKARRAVKKVKEKI